MKLFAILALLACMLSWGQCMTTTVMVNDGEVVMGTVVATPASDVLYQFNLSSTATSARVSISPCSGAIDWFVALNRIPTAMDNDFSWEFPDAGLPEDAPELFLQDYINNNIAAGANNTVYTLVTFSTALDVFNGDQSPGFQALFMSEQPSPFAAVPQPSGLTLQDRTETSVLASWNASPDEASQNLQYCLYGHPEEGHEGTDIHGSGCYAVTQNDDFFGCTTDTQITISNLDADAWHLDLVVMQLDAPMLISYIDFSEIGEFEDNAASALQIQISAFFALLAFLIF